MSKLKLATYALLAKVAEAKGFKCARRVGSHNTFRDASGKIIVIPDHGSTMIFRPLLHKILRDMGVSAEEYEKILKEL